MKTAIAKTIESTFFRAGLQFNHIEEALIIGVDYSELKKAKDYVNCCQAIDFTYISNKAKLLPSLFIRPVFLSVDHESNDFICSDGKSHSQQLRRLGINQQIENIKQQLIDYNSNIEFPRIIPNWSVIDLHRKWAIHVFDNFAIVNSSPQSTIVHSHDVVVIFESDE